MPKGRPTKPENILTGYSVLIDAPDSHGRRYVVLAEYEAGPWEQIHRAHHMHQAQEYCDMLNQRRGS